MKPHYHWQFQRLTALFLVFALPLFLGLLFYWKTSNYHEIILSLKNPALTVFIALTVLVALYHAVLGAQVIIADYIKGPSEKILLFFIYGIAFILMLITLMSLLAILFRC
jgi:succinate dehydrogenase / fumarate reductase membrane anchor subunit